MPDWLRYHMPEHVPEDCSFPSQVHLVLTRCLYPAPSIPVRGEECFDTFEWVRQVAVDFLDTGIPPGCLIFTDGSLMDCKLPPECFSLGWAFCVIKTNGDIVASARGVPPRWVNTIQGAELWAVRMALMRVSFPEGLYTDCDTVRLGLLRGPAWANSAKRKYSRVWSSTVTLLDEGGGRSSSSSRFLQPRF